MPDLRTVWRVELNPPGYDLTVELPAGATFVHLGFQTSRTPRAVAWFLVDPDAPPERRRLTLVATGAPVIGTYLGTVVMPSDLVWHLVELPKGDDRG